jgi:hypothetical protein
LISSNLVWILRRSSYDAAFSALTAASTALLPDLALVLELRLLQRFDLEVRGRGAGFRLRLGVIETFDPLPYVGRRGDFDLRPDLGFAVGGC